MIQYEDLFKTQEYWLETLQNEIYRQVDHYLKENHLSQKEFAKQLGVSKGYVSQVLKGEFNYTLKKLIELSLSIGKAPEINFIDLDKHILAERKRVDILYQPMKSMPVGAHSMPIGKNSVVLDYNNTNPNPVEATAAA